MNDKLFQSGQAFVELLLVMPVMLLLMAAAHWLFTLQHTQSVIQVRATDDAWRLTRLAMTGEQPSTLSRRLVHLTPNEGVQTTSLALGVSDPTNAIAAGLSTELDTFGQGLAYRLQHRQKLAHQAFSAVELIQDHVTLVGAAHAVTPQRVQQRIAQSDVLWGEAYRRSRRVGETIARYSAPVDAAWRRPAPNFDWLGRWQSSVPTRYQQGRSR